MVNTDSAKIAYITMFEVHFPFFSKPLYSNSKSSHKPKKAIRVLGELEFRYDCRRKGIELKILTVTSKLRHFGSGSIHL